MAHLKAAEIGALRLTVKAFTAHPAVRNSCTSAQLGESLTRPQLQAGLRYLCQLPRLQQLRLEQPGSVYGVQQLTQLCRLEIWDYAYILDLAPLGGLPMLTSLRLADCSAERMDNLSELSRSLVSLRVSAEGLHHQVPSLTALRELTIDPELEGWGAGEEFRLYSGLTGLTSLCVDISGDAVWQGMPCLRTLHVLGTSHRVSGIAAATTLRALRIDLGDSFALPSLAPLSSLIYLERLFLVHAESPLPALPALTRLTLQADSVCDNIFSDFPTEPFPALVGLSSLRELHLEPCEDMHLPDLSVHSPGLSRIVFSVRVNSQGQLIHRLSMCVQLTGRLSMSVLEMPRYGIERRGRLLGISEDDY